MLREITILDTARESRRIIRIAEGDNRDITFTDEDKENGYTSYVKIETYHMIENTNLKLVEDECGILKLKESFHEHFKGDLKRLVYEATNTVWVAGITDWLIIHNGYNESKYHTWQFNYDSKYDDGFGSVQFCTQTKDEAIDLFKHWCVKESGYGAVFPYESIEDISCDFDDEEYGINYAYHTV